MVCLMKWKKQCTAKTYNNIDYQCMLVYDDVFGTERGFFFLEPGGMLAHDPATGKNYFCLSEDKDTFLDRCHRSLECGRNLFAEEWREWEDYKEDYLY